LRRDGEIIDLNELDDQHASWRGVQHLEIIVDRLLLQEGVEERLRDSLETALRWGKNTILVLVQEPGETTWREDLFSTDFCHPKTGFTMEPLTPKQFSFNNPSVACASCHGLGKVAGTLCSTCDGRRFAPHILGVTLPGREREWNIDDLCRLSITAAVTVVRELQITERERSLIQELLRAITTRLHFLEEVGLGYLTLERESRTLSGGEIQRIRLATQMGSALSGVLYVLDEPSIGLHQRDHGRLLRALMHLRDLGNSLIVVEHDEETMKAADHFIDLGPGAGLLGGEIVAAGSLEELQATTTSLTGAYLSGRQQIQLATERHHPASPESSKKGWLTVVGARHNSLKNLTVSFPVGLLTSVTGVSGSGKSTLVHDVLYRAVARQLHRANDEVGVHDKILGAEQFDRVIMIDQSPIGRTSRSNPATYVGIFDTIRELFAQLPAARMRGYQRSRFSFNIKGGRCEACHGEGVRHVEMHFLPAVEVLCDACEGKRFHRDLLEISYKGRDIAEVLAMSIDEARQFFSAVPKIAHKLDQLTDLGLGYLTLGQSATTLSGGEAQRLKLAAELARVTTLKRERTLYILDEPTTGLHFVDVQQLLELLIKLRDAGNTVIVIEHHLDVIRWSDWVIDLGPEGGEGGGEIVIVGTPEEVAACEKSATGFFLKKKLEQSVLV
jgi:excinuclease ABC subunit A